jgi:hypothetical protein
MTSLGNEEMEKIGGKENYIINLADHSNMPLNGQIQF